MVPRGHPIGIGKDREGRRRAGDEVIQRAPGHGGAIGIGELANRNGRNIERERHLLTLRLGLTNQGNRTEAL